MANDNWNVIDLDEWRQRREVAAMQNAIHDAKAGLIPELGTIEQWIRSGQPPTQEQAAAVMKYLAQIIRMGLFGYHARTWAAALLLDLRRHESAVAGLDKVPMVEAAAALRVFDAVVFGDASPDQAFMFAKG